MSKKKLNSLALVGATGAVGEEFIRVLAEHKFKAKTIKFLASEKSVGKKISYLGQEIAVEKLTESSFNGVKLAFFTAGSAISKKYAPLAAKSGALVIDNSSAYRMEKDVPLIVPEVNGESLVRRPTRRIIANPNCSTIQMVIALAPIHRLAGVKRVVVATYQAVSGAGRKAMDELSKQVSDLLNCRQVKNKVFPHRIAFNCIPQIDQFLADGDTKEERKMEEETKKILSSKDLGVTATAVRVPVFVGHSEAVNVETVKAVKLEAIRQALEEAPGVEVIDSPADSNYPLASLAATKDSVYVGRLRKDRSLANAFNLWIVADNLRKGAALNAIQIAELCLKNKLLD